jgi:hypothetical protein
MTNAQAVESHDCKPRALVEWIKARQAGCLDREYVCQNLFFKRAVADPEFWKGKRDSAYAAVTSGGANAFGLMWDVMTFVDTVRAENGCPKDPRT